MSSIAARQVGSELAPNSPRKPLFPLARSQLVKPESPCDPIVALTHAGLLPPALSRYWCTSKAKLLPGSWMVSMTVESGVPYQFADQDAAPSHPLPGTRIRLVAPALRTAAIAALAALAHCSVGMSCGSFIRPNITCALPLNAAASRDQRSAKSALGTAGEPMIEVPYRA